MLRRPVINVDLPYASASSFVSVSVCMCNCNCICCCICIYRKTFYSCIALHLGVFIKATFVMSAALSPGPVLPFPSSFPPSPPHPFLSPCPCTLSSFPCFIPLREKQRKHFKQRKSKFFLCCCCFILMLLLLLLLLLLLVIFFFFFFFLSVLFLFSLLLLLFLLGLFIKLIVAF